MMKKFLVFGFALLVPVALASAATITAGNHNLASGGGVQTIDITVSGGDAVQGLILNLQIDGGMGGPPNIVGCDIVGPGTVFSASNNGDFGGGALLPQIWNSQTTTVTGTVAAVGLLATVSIDVGAAPDGVYVLSLTSLNGPTDLAGTPATLVDGTITIPEPTTALLLIGALPFLRHRR